jgi:metallophosphoesterase (TIGR00282 family)
MKILALGDIVGPKSVEELGKKLWNYRKENKIDFVVANGENASRGNGLDPDSAQSILDYGVDVITGGNHIWQKNSLRDFLDSNKNIVRPANFPSSSAGNGYTIVDCMGYKLLVINVSGTIYMESLSCPFDAVEKILEKEQGNYDVSILDVHAEATSEKYALARCFDGKINVIFGTHTHVPTADNQILPGGSGYITDLGMCGPKNSILGVKSEIIIEKLRTKMPIRFEFDEQDIVFSGAIFDVDVDISGKVTVKSVKRAEF